MDSIAPRLLELFYEVQRGLPRQGPGDRESTLRALRLCSELPGETAVLDIGCGPGMQTIALAEATTGPIVAVDNCEEYLEQLRRRVQQAGLTSRVEIRQADMMDLDIAAGSLDLIWCEGAAYIMGIAKVLESWRPLLRDGAYLAFTELIWLTDNPPVEVAEFFQEEYPAMTSRDATAQIITHAGYELVGDFTLSDSAWWNDYYTPLESKLPSLKLKYQADEQALGVIAMTEAEIDMRSRFGGAYGYQFFVCRKAG